MVLNSLQGSVVESERTELSLSGTQNSALSRSMETGLSILVRVNSPSVTYSDFTPHSSLTGLQPQLLHMHSGICSQQQQVQPYLYVFSTAFTARHMGVASSCTT